MSFHPAKCTVIHNSTNRGNLLDTHYFLHGHKLEVVDTGKYLGVTLSEDLSWRKHVEATSFKASRTLGFMRRNFRDCNKSVREQAYTTMVQPTVEYASAAWDPYASDQINKFDKVQRRAARFVSNNYRDKTSGCVTAMVKSLGCEPLTKHRKGHKLIMMYKVMHGLVCIPESSYIWSKRRVTPEPEVPTD
jgi:hypothetical protein